MDAKNVFVVYGRNNEARSSMFAFLRSIGLKPLEWSQIVAATRQGSPYVGDVLNKGFSIAKAIVVLFTPDDVAKLRKSLQGENELPFECELTPQPRQNVLFEAGMAMGINPDRTIIVELGALRPISDITGRHIVRMDNSTAKRQELANRLKTAGCEVDLHGTDWHTTGDFTKCIPEPETEESQEQPLKRHSESVDDFEQDYLLTISRPRNEGFIYGGLDDHKGRDVAPYQEAMERFQTLNLVAYSSGGYKLTTRGWKLADQLWQLKVLDVLSEDEIISDEEIAKAVELTDGEAELKEVRRHLAELEKMKFVSISKTRGGWSAWLTQAGITHRTHRPISL